MKKSYITFAISIIVILLISGVAYYFLTKENPTITENTNTLLPQSGTSVPVTERNYTVSASDGSTIHTKDFVNNGETIPDVENKGTYLLAGTLGYCLPDIKCTAATTTDFNISYDSIEKGFTVALLTEPIGKARIKAEDFLRTRLGITNDELCRLKVYVGTTYWINEKYAAGNLGLSFCSGATQLP